MQSFRDLLQAIVDWLWSLVHHPWLLTIPRWLRAAILSLLLLIIAAIIQYCVPTPAGIRGMEVPPSRAFAFIAPGNISEAAKPGGWMANNPDIKTIVFSADWYNVAGGWSFVTNGLDALPDGYKAIVRLKVSEYWFRSAAGFTFDPAMPESQMGSGYFLVSGDIEPGCNARRPNFPAKLSSISAMMVDFADTFADDDRVLGVIIGTGVTGEAAPFKQSTSRNCLTPVPTASPGHCDYCMWKEAAEAAMSANQFVNNYVVPLTLDVARAWDVGTGGQDKWIMVHLASSYSNVTIANPWRDQLDAYRVGVWDSGLKPAGMACSRASADPNVNRYMLKPGWDYYDSYFSRTFGSQWQQHLVTGRDSPGASELGGTSSGTYPGLDGFGFSMWNAIISASKESSGYAFWSDLGGGGKPDYEIIDPAVVAFVNKFVGIDPLVSDTVWIVFQGREPENDPWCPNYLNMPYGINSDLELAARWTKASSVSVANGGAAGNADDVSLAVEFTDPSLSEQDYRYLTARRVSSGMPIFLDVLDAWTPGEYATIDIDYLSGGPGETFTLGLFTELGEQAITVTKDSAPGWHTFELVLDDLVLDNGFGGFSSGYLQEGARFDFRITDGGDGGDVLHSFELSSDVEPPAPTPVPTEPPPETDYLLPIIADAYMDEWNPDVNYGGAISNRIRTSGVQQPLFKLDISEIPAAGDIESATFHFYQTRDPSSVQDVEALRMLRSWSEFDVTSVVATSGSAWEIPNAQGASDRDPTGYGLTTMTGIGFYELDVTGLVEYWRANPDSNLGFKIETVDPGGSIYHTIASRENGTSAWHPYVHVVFRPPYVTPTPTPVPSTATHTPVPTATHTPTLTPTLTPVPPTATHTPTLTPTLTPVPPTATHTPTLTPTPTFTHTPTITPTPEPDATDTPIPTATHTPTLTPTPTITPTPIVAECFSGWLVPTPAVAGEIMTYYLFDAPLAPEWRQAFRIDGGSTWYCDFGTTSCSIDASGEEVAYYTDLRYVIDEQLYICGEGGTWSPVPPPGDAICLNTCGGVSSIVTATPVPTATHTPTWTPTATHTPTLTPTITPTPTDTPTPTATPVPSTATHTPTHTPTWTPTATVPPPTWTPTLTPIPTLTPTPKVCVIDPLPLCEDHELATPTPVMTPPATIRPPLLVCVPRGEQPNPICTVTPTASPPTATPFPPPPGMLIDEPGEGPLTWWEIVLRWLGVLGD